MNMVPHEAIADDTYRAPAGVVGQQLEVQDVIGVFGEDALAAVAALRDVMPATRDNDAGDACHGEYLWIWRGKTLIKFRGFVACPRNSLRPGPRLRNRRRYLRHHRAVRRDTSRSLAYGTSSSSPVASKRKIGKRGCLSRTRGSGRLTVR